jgi:hypothetical protein
MKRIWIRFGFGKNLRSAIRNTERLGLSIIAFVLVAGAAASAQQAGKVRHHCCPN